MVQDFADLLAVELHRGVHEVAEADASHIQDQVRVVRLALRVERIITQLVTVGFIMDALLLFEVVAVRVRRENDLVAANNYVVRSLGFTYLCKGRLLWCR